MKYTIQEGDTLGTIALRFLGNANRYVDLWRRNYAVLRAAQQQGEARRKLGSGPDWIYPGTVIEIDEPSSPASEGA